MLSINSKNNEQIIKYYKNEEVCIIFPQPRYFFNKINKVFVADRIIEVRKQRTTVLAIGFPTDKRGSCASWLTINFEIFDLRSVSRTLYACEQWPPTPEHYIYSSIQSMYVRMYTCV